MENRDGFGRWSLPDQREQVVPQQVLGGLPDAGKMEENLLYRKKWCRTVLGFLIDKLGKSQGLEIFLQVVDEQHHLAHFDSIEKDLMEWIKVLSAVDFTEIDILLIAQFGRGLLSKLERKSGEVELIKGRGEIATDDEYRLILSYIDEKTRLLERMPPSEKTSTEKSQTYKRELNALYALLLTYK